MFPERTSQRSAKIKKGRHEEIGILQVSIAVLPVLIFSGRFLADEILCVFPDCFLAIINCFIAVPFMYTYLYVHTYYLYGGAVKNQRESVHTSALDRRYLVCGGWETGA